MFSHLYICRDQVLSNPVMHIFTLCRYIHISSTFAVAEIEQQWQHSNGLSRVSTGCAGPSFLLMIL